MLRQNMLWLFMELAMVLGTRFADGIPVTMDIARPDVVRKRRKRRLVLALFGLVALAGVTMGLRQLQPAAPLVDKATLFLGKVKRGEMLREVHGKGLLVPEEIVWIPARNAGRIERILVLPGATVGPETPLIEMSNPELEQAAFDAKWALREAEAGLANLKVTLESQRLTQEAAAASLESEYNLARLDAEADAKLAAEQIVAELTAKRSAARADDLKSRHAIELRRLAIIQASIDAQMEAENAKLERLRADLRLRQEQLDSLRVRARIPGVLQKLGEVGQLQVGQQIAAGFNLARVANPSKLKAEIRIPEVLARDLRIGQVVRVDTRNGIIPAKVSRIDPAVQNGTVLVDASLEGPLPPGARPDLTIDGTIEIERIPGALHVERMVQGAEDSSITVFKVAANGRDATRVAVRLGRVSVSTVEVLSGLAEGDQIVLSDLSNYDSWDRLRLN